MAVLAPGDAVFAQLDHISKDQILEALNRMSEYQVERLDSWLSQYAQAFPGLHQSEVMNGLTAIAVETTLRTAVAQSRKQ